MTDERIKELLGGIQHSSYEVGLMPGLCFADTPYNSSCANTL
jgi:hypothetical protein